MADRLSADGTLSNSKNVADDIQRLIRIQTSSDFIQEIVSAPGTPPALILYKQEQMEDIRRLGRNGNVIGIDRTFNLGSVFLTALTYKNTKVIRNSTGEHPICLGPVYLHWNGNYETYHRFLSHCSGRLSVVEGAEQMLLIGSDQEKALIRAIQQSFPKSTLLLCTKHMKDNVIRQLDIKTATNAHVKKSITKELFATESGLVNSTDLTSFDEKALELRDKYERDNPDFATYFDKLLPKIRDHVVKPRVEGKICSSKWTNNNAESINHIIKSIVNWKQVSLPELVAELEKEATVQTRKLELSLTNRGEFSLHPSMGKFYCHPKVWDSKTREEKTKRFSKFINAEIEQRKTVIVSTSTVTSTDGLLSVPRPKSKIARKPGQRKRSRSTRTYTPIKKSKIC